MKTDFDKKLVKGVKVLVIDKMTKWDYIFVLTEDYREINSYIGIYIEYKNGIQERENGFIHSTNFDPTTNKADVYIIAEEF